MDVLTSHSKRFATGRQDVCLGRFTDDALGQSGRGIDHVLAVVENKKEFLLTEKSKKTAKRIVGLHHESERCCDSCWDKLGIGQHTEINKEYSAFKAREQLVRNRDGDRSFADSAWADDAHEAHPHELLRYRSNGFDSANYLR
jgi:hypothetical protein